MYHPAAALHQASLRRTIEEDMLRIPSILSEMAKLARNEPEPKQLNLF
jgi:DNA polymerase